MAGTVAAARSRSTPVDRASHPASNKSAPRSSRLVVCDVAVFYGERSGGIRTYLDEKARYARESGAFEHHVVVPGRRESHEGSRHHVRSLSLAASNGYRIPYGAGALKQTLRRISPDVVVMHDPFWRPAGVTREAHRLGARVVVVHHASVGHTAAGIPGPDALYLPFIRRIFRHAYGRVDAVMSAIDSTSDADRAPTIQLRLGLHPAFRPGPGIQGEHLLYVGRLALEKNPGVALEALAMAPRPRELRIVGEGPLRGMLEAKAQRLGIADRVRFGPFVSDREKLARLYREAACVVATGPHETFGLVVLEAAASGARVVACSSTPAAYASDGLVETYRPKDAVDLRRAIDRRLSRAVDVGAAAALADGLRWERVFESELEDLERLVL